ncbi:MAG: putative drug exporter of the superfamily, partial [Actinomycetota bacterium]|nr:putative drug exporter of the superfamily [Actinomycetota bacterium]
LTFLPGLLLLPGRLSSGEHGRWIFWPGVPHVGSQNAAAGGLWGKVSRTVGAYPRRVWIATAAVLTVLAACLPLFEAEGTAQTDFFLTEVESVTGQEALVRHFDAGSGDPTIVIGPAEDLTRLEQIITDTPGVAALSVTGRDDAAPGPAGEQTDPKVVDGRVEIEVTLTEPADSPSADRTVESLRTALDDVGPDAFVGGRTAQNLDSRRTASADRNRIIPVTLLVIVLVLMLLLRSLPAPLLLLGANVLSFGATIGVSALVFNHVLDFPGAEPSVPLYGFVFLVALGIDYSIFLMTRVREESFRQGTRPGTLTGLTVTGGVITSAGVVLAATFATLGVLPLLFLAQTAFIVAFGVLLDTFVVRSLLVPALTYDWGDGVWWPRRPAPLALPSGPDTVPAPPGPVPNAEEDK